MSQRAADIIEVDASEKRFDTTIEWLMIALLAFMPLAFGAVEAWSELVVVALTGAMAACLALKLLWRRHVRLVWTWAYVPIGLFLLLVVLQLVPLPAKLVAAVSPNTAATKTKLLGDLPNAAVELKSMTLSFYPLATKHDLRLLLATVVVFVVVLNVYRRPDQIKRLLGAIALIGGGIALLALAQDLFGNGRIYWIVPTASNKANSGTFICHSHYGQFMNLSIGAALGLLLLKLHESFRHGPITLPAVVERLSQPKLRVVWCLAGMTILGVTTIFVSLTRGGAISLLIAGGFTALVLASRRAMKGRGWIMMVLALGAFICVLYIGFDAVYDRLATLRDRQAYQGRWQIVEDLSVSFTRFPVVGTGLGTHEVVYPMFDRSTSPSLAGHAENEYAQIAEETGIIGLALLLVFLGIVWHRYAHNARHLRFPVRSAAFGLGFGLLAIQIHSFSDFGQHLLANSCLTAVSCGLLIGLARMGHLRTKQPRWWAALGGLRPLRVAGMLGVGAVSAWALVGANNARSAEAHWKKALALEGQLRQNDWSGTNRDYADLISHAAAAADCEPGNVKYRHWLNVYRWRSISRVTDPETGEVVVTPRTVEFTRRIVDELHQARALCPTFGATYCVVGQLERFVLNQPAGADRIRTGYALAPCDPTATYVAGLMDVHEGEFDASLAKFRRSLALGGGPMREVIDLYIRQANRPDLAVAIAGDNPSWLLHVANTLHKNGDHQELAAKARANAVAIQKARCEEPDAPASVLASVANIFVQEEDYPAAIKCYRRALALDYGQVSWRLALAHTLAKTGRIPEAMHEARICLRLRPQMTAARKLIGDLSVLPDAMPDE